jgi:glycosyltransferase involved in cell wall biosynthesis
MFRTTGEFGFPYEISGKDQDLARKYSRKLWLSNKWPNQKRDVQWILDKFAPVPTWEQQERPLVSVIIPARNEQYLQRTIDDCLVKIKCDFEIIVGADGYLPDLKEDPRVVLCHSKKRIGMRPMINKMARMARGKYLMRLDAHCIVDEGICEKLIACHEKGSLVLAMRYELKSSNWTRRERTDCPYRYLSHYKVDPKGGLRGLAWPEYAEEHKDERIGETMTISGSNWLVERDQFWDWGGMNEEYGTFGQEGVEMSCMAWLSGGRVLVNKDTWYAHWNRKRSPYSLGSGQKPKSMKQSMDIWLNDKWPHATRKFQWLIDKFNPPGWNRFYIHPYDFKVRTRNVDELYTHFKDYYHPKKIDRDNPRGYYQFIKTFVPFAESVLNGDTFSDAELKELPYYGYLIKHLNKRYKYSHPELPERSHRYLVKKMRNAESLAKSIKKSGLNTPIDIVNWEGRDVIIKGCRRLVVLHLLGIEKVLVRMFGSMKSFEQMDKVLSARSGGKIEKAAMSQYIEHGKDSTDKYYKHNYTYLYDRYIKKPKKILEIGVKHGASLDMWRRAFPKAKIFGIDIKDVSQEKFAKNFDLFIGSQNDRSFLRTVGKHYDLIVDDGSHKVEDIIISMEELWPRLKPGGWYVIEDIFMTGKGRKNMGKTQRLMDKIKTMSDEICFTKTVRTVAFHLNICFIQKN